VTYASNAPELVGNVFALNKQTVTIGRRAEQDVCVAEATVSGGHASMRWSAGTWILDDLGSTNGSYTDHSYDRKQQLTIIHGGEAQVGELRIKLVSFANDSLHHRRARQFLAKRDGLTGLLIREHMLKSIDEEAAFAEWAELPFHLARYELRGPNRNVSERPTILEMLALRKAAQRVVELSETLMLSLTPVVAARTGPLKFVISMVGPAVDEARHIVEQAVSQVQGIVPDSLELAAALIKGEPGRAGRTLLD
jgi:hypothetical protein